VRAADQRDGSARVGRGSVTGTRPDIKQE